MKFNGAEYTVPMQIAGAVTNVTKASEGAERRFSPTSHLFEFDITMTCELDGKPFALHIAGEGHDF